MKKSHLSVIIALALLAGCTSAQKSQSDSKTGMNKTEKGAVVGATSGAVVGGIIGNRSKNTALGAILGMVSKSMMLVLPQA